MGNELSVALEFVKNISEIELFKIERVETERYGDNENIKHFWIVEIRKLHNTNTTKINDSNLFRAISLAWKKQNG